MQEKEYLKPLGQDPFPVENRMRVRLETDKNKVLKLVYQYEALMDEVWTPIVRFDNAHGQQFHKDTMHPNGTQTKEMLAINPLKKAADFAVQDILQKWQFYRERYLKERNAYDKRRSRGK